MARPVILFADNNPDYLEECAKFLEVSGFKVIKAPDVTNAKTILEGGGVDLAIIDMRLTNDSDKRDVSGLKLAQTSGPNVQKIVLSHFPTFEAAKEALGQRLVGLSPAADFVD